MLKVLHLINYPGKGGSERYILSLAEKLHKKECMFYLGYSMDGPMLERLKEMDIQAFNIPMSGPCDLKAAGNVAGFCRKLSIDIVHTHFLRENYISIISKIFGNKARLVNTSHLVTEKSAMLKFSNRMMTVFDDRIIAVCNAGKRQMQAEGIASRKIEVIHNGVDVDYLGEGYTSSIRNELGMGEKDFIVTYTARFGEEKGQKFLIECARELKSAKNSFNIKDRIDLDKLKFLLVGDGELLEECKKSAGALMDSGDIIFTGFRTDIRNILHSSDLFASPSKSEALSLSIIEALACGLPAVATNAGGTSEIINERHNCGILIEYGDVDGFVKAVLKFMQDGDFYNRCKENACKTAGGKFSLDKMAGETYNLYISCLSQGVKRKRCVRHDN